VLAIVIKDLPYLKLLQPVINELTDKKYPFVLICLDSYKSEKEYNRPSKARVEKSFGRPITTIPILNDFELMQKLIKLKIKKVLSVEVGLWNSQVISAMIKAGIKVYSVEYLTDTMWPGARVKMSFSKVYYTTRITRDIGLCIGRVPLDSERDMCIGSPIFDQLDRKTEADTLIMMPNIRVADVKGIFKSKANFISLIESFGSNLIIKSRRKQWMPPEIERLSKDIYYDDEVMYPSTISKLFPRTNRTVMFFSSGIYESVYANQYVVNIPLPLSIWKWNKDNMVKYFGSEVYNYGGVVETVSQADIMGGKWTQGAVDPIRRQEWINSLIGKYTEPSYLTIARDVMNDV
jgi:hypothetical protein